MPGGSEIFAASTEEQPRVLSTFFCHVGELDSKQRLLSMEGRHLRPKRPCHGLDLNSESISGIIEPSISLFSLQYLKRLNLANNSFNSTQIPPNIGNLTNLRYLNLSNAGFSGQIPVGLPSFQSSKNLRYVDLSYNALTGPIPNSLGNHSQLVYLDLSANNFSGAMPSFQSSKNLRVIRLSRNALTGPIPSTYFEGLLNLEYVILAYNSFNGSIPSSLFSLQSLLVIQLSNNKFDEVSGIQNGSLSPLDTIPSRLRVLDLHSNQLCGEIPIPPESTYYVDYSSNNFSHSIPVGIGNNLPSAFFFSLSNNSLTGAIPESVCNVSLLQVLDLSNNRLSGTIPQCLIDICTATLGVLNLQNNNLTGSIRGTFPEFCALETLNVNGNQLEGQVPKSLANCTSLEVLNLGNNKMNGNFPCFLKNSSSLRVIVLRSNKFQGSIRCRGIQRNIWPKLQIIDLALNNFSGDLPPKVFLHWKAMMPDGGNAQPNLNTLHFELLYNDNLYYQDRVTLTFKGLQMELVKILTIFTSIDLSSNNFRGEIPDTLGALKSLYVLNLSHNALTGSIPSSLGNLSQLESLDLSWNKLSGSIPLQLASLTFLSFLNLSYNQLVGMIPRGSQFQTFTETSFQGNPGLYGSPLNACCGEAEPPGSSGPTSNDVHSEINWVYISATLGYSMGFGVVVAPLFYWKRWRTWHDKHVDRAISRVLRLEDRQAGYQRRRENRNLIRRRQNR